MKKKSLSVLLAALMFVGAVTIGTWAGGAEGETLIARATLIDTTGAEVGSATFKQTSNGRVRVTVQVSGLTRGKHGIHVHAIGLCDPAAFTSAGSHFNPTSSTHGHHAGDLGNISINNRGSGKLRLNTTQFTLSDGSLSILDGDGSALIIHAGEDDLVTNPTGNSGARVVCGVITPPF